MNNHSYNKICLFVILALITIGGMTSCKEDLVKVATIDEAGFQSSKDALAFITNGEGKINTGNLEFRNSGTTTLQLNLSKAAPDVVNASLAYNEAVLDNYNKQNGTTYTLFPKELLTLSNNGLLQVAKGENKSTQIEVQVKTATSLSTDVSYVIPVRTTISSGNALLSARESDYLIFVKDLSKIPTAAKSTGIEIISCMEVNDTNPLNNLSFTLKGSGKPLIDMVILFSSNINYNEETGKVYVYHNPNVQHLLDNRMKYLKPLKDRGIKVVLSILGNHDRAGVANLSDNTAREFAKELKAVCDAYDLDGVFFDDEYSKEIYPPPPGFVYPSSDAAARLFYETKKVMPNKLTLAYVYSSTRSFNAVDGIQPGQFVDYGLHDYGGSYDLSGNYPGMSKKGMALYSQEFARGYYTTAANLKRLRDGGYGAHMIFAMDPNRSNFLRQQRQMSDIAKTLFDDELVFDGKIYKKDW
ncbi:BT_3987 domain-containing protein [Sphingobacterium spiritivorum]|uniref:BT_3987 domain-containing protein n=1 Tax=Sphingobacterium spiritivorum TaxID=258 RepID=UPI003DA4584F